MRCPFCAHDDSQVKDSRPTEDNTSIRRRRQCESCGARFTTFERVQLREIAVVKSDDSRETFDRSKIDQSVALACRKRGIPQERLDQLVSGIQRQIETLGEAEVPSKAIGEMVMEGLRQLDSVAYIRFASRLPGFRRGEGFRGICQHGAGCRVRGKVRNTQKTPFVPSEVEGPFAERSRGGLRHKNGILDLYTSLCRRHLLHRTHRRY